MPARKERRLPHIEHRAIESVAVIGAGYVGLPLCLLLAREGLVVTAVDVDPEVVRKINAGAASSGEKDDLATFFEHPAVRSNLRAQATPVAADVFVIAVPTPMWHDPVAGERPDLRAVVAASESIVPFLRPGNLVIVESTVPPRTTAEVVGPLLEKSGYRVGSELLLAHCPERIFPGDAMAEAVENARVIGGVDRRSTERAAELFGRFVHGELMLTTDRTAELVKLVENSYRDIAIAFANQVALYCDELGVDTGEAIELANHHPRVDILKPGIGVGGHCIPVDPLFLVDACPEVSGLLRAARRLNDEMPRRTAEKVLRSVEGVSEPRVVCLGATYKPNVRDTRESPALEVFAILQESGIDVSLFDPLLEEYAGDSVLAAARGADALVLLVPHEAIVRELRQRKVEILAAMRRPHLLAFTPGIL